MIRAIDEPVDYAYFVHLFLTLYSVPLREFGNYDCVYTIIISALCFVFYILNTYIGLGLIPGICGELQ